MVRSLIRPVPINLGVDRPRVGLGPHAPVWLIADPSSFSARLAQEFDAAGCRSRLIPGTTRRPPDEPGGLAGLVLVAPDDPVPDDLPSGVPLAQAGGPGPRPVRESGGAFFATVTRLDGAFGLGPLDPAAGHRRQGAWPGWPRRPRHEWPEVACKAIDLDPTVLPAVRRDILIERS